MDSDTERIRRAWLARLGTPIALDFPLFPVEDAFPRGHGVTVALGELATGRVVAGDALEAVGVAFEPVPVEVRAIERPAAGGRGVEPVVAALAGGAFGLTLGHAPEHVVVSGQCLAPHGRLSSAATVAADVWMLGEDDLPGTPVELRRMLADVAAGRALDLFFHTRSVAARCAIGWTPVLGAEARVRFDLAHPVALYPGVRFAVRYDGLVVGVGVVDGNAEQPIV
jgi:translation elongation factor EF-Tu-like GTPase